MKHLIMHQQFIESRKVQTKQITCNEDMSRRNQAVLARMTIDSVIKQEPASDVIDYYDGDPKLVADLFNPGDQVTLYGAYLNGCLKDAEEALIAKGVKVQYHPRGCINF